MPEWRETAENLRQGGVIPLQSPLACDILPLDKYIEDSVPVFSETGGGMG